MFHTHTNKHTNCFTPCSAKMFNAFITKMENAPSSLTEKLLFHPACTKELQRLEASNQNLKLKRSPKSSREWALLTDKHHCLWYKRCKICIFFKKGSTSSASFPSLNKVWMNMWSNIRFPLAATCKMYLLYLHTGLWKPVRESSRRL